MYLRTTITMKLEKKYEFSTSVPSFLKQVCMYKTITSHIGLYRCHTWSLTLREEQGEKQRG
jgi:hypothetical protein